MTAGASSPPGYRLTAWSDLTDSALPGRKEAVSFSWASSNLPEKSPPTTAVITKNTAATANLLRFPAGKVRNRPISATVRSRGSAWISVEQRGQLVRLGHRSPAGEALAHVGGGAAVDRLAPGQQRHAVGLAPGEDHVRAEPRAHHALERGEVRPDKGDLAHGRDVEVD